MHDIIRSEREYDNSTVTCVCGRENCVTPTQRGFPGFQEAMCRLYMFLFDCSFCSLYRPRLSLLDVANNVPRSNIKSERNGCLVKKCSDRRRIN